MDLERCKFYGCWAEFRRNTDDLWMSTAINFERYAVLTARINARAGVFSQHDV